MVLRALFLFRAGRAGWSWELLPAPQKDLQQLGLVRAAEAADGVRCLTQSTTLGGRLTPGLRQAPRLGRQKPQQKQAPLFL